MSLCKRLKDMKPKFTAKQYANILCGAAEKIDALIALDESFFLVEKLIQSHAQFRSFVLSKRISADQKKQSLRAILGDDCHPIMIEFIGMVSGVQAGKLILNTGKLVHAKVKETLNKISVTAHVADEMNDVEAAKLKTSLESILGKTTDLDFVIDKKLMGGIKLRIDNIFLDASIQNKLNGLRSNLMQS